MNKQQLASKIWESANKMRSKIEANEYKDYILGFIFYKFLSEKEEEYLDRNQLPKELRKTMLVEENLSVKKNLQDNLGYFISYDNLFSTWIKESSKFGISSVRDALNAFDRNISPASKKVFSDIFTTLLNGLSKLGESDQAQKKSAQDLIYLIKDIPMNNKEGYDVLGYIYEYLLDKFASNAGKKAGEFYTPHEVSLLMSEIIAEHLKNREEIEIYDPTSGSGSLLINIGKATAKYIKGENKIKYYAQELKQNTYNLTRMNLVMRGILPQNIVTRNGDTLEEDWPFFDENHAYSLTAVDAVVSNPPYSQSWNPEDKDMDKRFKEYGIAPKGKADYAFLLHDLYHLRSNGIMTIVLPHGVLFRGGDEQKIRKNLIEYNNIDTIIGLPANIFFGTPIPTIIMVLKKQRNDTDVQIIDASKGYIKEGKNNKLRACDIKKIVDTIIERKNIEKFSKVVSREEIRQNDYNLNIPRYVDSSDEQEKYDIYSSMYGGIPYEEIEKCEDVWNAFPSLKDEMLNRVNEKTYELKNKNIREIVDKNHEVCNFICSFDERMREYKEYLGNNLVKKAENIDVNAAEKTLGNKLFEMFENDRLVNKYDIYQILDDNWNTISADLEIIQTEGIGAVKKVDPRMIVKKKEKSEEEVQDGYVGRIIPFGLIQKYKLNEELEKINKKNSRMEEISAEYQELFDSIEDEAEKEEIASEDNSSFDFKKISEKIKEIKKNKSKIGDLENILVKVNDLKNEEKEINKQLKKENLELEGKTKEIIENLSEDEIYEALNKKWVDSIIEKLALTPKGIINNFEKNIKKISEKYEITLTDLDKEIKMTEKELSNMINDLVGDEFDMQGLEELKKLLGGV